MSKRGVSCAVVVAAVVATYVPEIVAAKGRRGNAVVVGREIPLDVVDARDADRLYRHAQDAYVHGRFAEAIALSERLIIKGQRILGASACSSKDRTRALEAYRGVDPRGRALMRQICSANNVRLAERARRSARGRAIGQRAEIRRRDRRGGPR